MDRNIVYPGSIPLDTDVLQVQRNVMLALGSLAQATLGTATVADGLACTQQTVPNLTVNVAPGSIVALSTVDATAFGSIAADATDALVKVGYNFATTILSGFAAPGTTGQSINYLVEAAFQESDTTPVILPYFNSANPAVAFSGPANSGTPQNTQRLQRVNLVVKAGTPATTGTQTTPAPDGGFVGLYVVTVAFAQTSVVTANISRYSAAPLASEQTGTGTRAGRLINVQTFTASGTYTPTPGTNKVRVTVIGGGGAGGGAPATGAGQVSIGGSGQAGAMGIGIITSGFAGTTVTRGAAGTGVSGLAGNSGGTSSFGAFITAPGGQGGTSGSAGAISNASGGATGAAATGGSILNITGAPGSNGGGTFSGGLAYNFIGMGGSTLFGGGGSSGLGVTGYGAGGGGSSNVASASALAGSVGAIGVVMVEEFS